MDSLLFAKLSKKIKSVSTGIKSIEPNEDNTAIVYTFTDGNTISVVVKNMHTHMNLNVLNLFTKDSSGNLLFDGKPITTGQEIDLTKYYTKTEVDSRLSNKAEKTHTHADYVKKETGKTLTSNDFTDDYKTKVDNIKTDLDKKAEKVHTHSITDITDLSNNYYTKAETLTTVEINTLVNNIANGMNWKSSVKKVNDLPIENNKISDTRVVTDTSTIMIWDGTAWISVGSSVNIPNASTTNDGLLTKEDYGKLTSIVVDNLVTKALLTSALADYVKAESLNNYAEKNHTHNNYVAKVSGKDLSSNDFTKDYKDKLDILKNYDDTEIKASIDKKADKSYVDNSVENSYKFKGSVNTKDDLPTNAKIGDIYKVIDIDSNMVWLGDVIKWNSTSSNVDLTQYQTIIQADDKYVAKEVGKSLVDDTEIEKIHSHNNKEDLDKLGHNDNGVLTYDGKIVNDLSNYYDKTESDTKFAEKTHNHTIADVTDLQDELDKKSNVIHNHDTVYSKLEHKHKVEDITDFPTTMKNPNGITIQLNGGTTEGTDKFSYDGENTKVVDITPDNIGASAKTHNHDTVYRKIEDSYSKDEIDTKNTTKQDKLKVGTNITISDDNTISATEIDDTKSSTISVYSSDKSDKTYESIANYNIDKGTTDISTIGDGTFTGAIGTLNTLVNNVATDEDIASLFN